MKAPIPCSIHDVWLDSLKARYRLIIRQLTDSTYIAELLAILLWGALNLFSYLEILILRALALYQIRRLCAVYCIVRHSCSVASGPC